MTAIIYHNNKLGADRRCIAPTTGCLMGNIYDQQKIFISKDRLAAMGVTGEVPQADYVENHFAILRVLHKRLLANSVENIKETLGDIKTMEGFKTFNITKSGYLHIMYTSPDDETPSIMNIDNVECRLHSGEKPLCMGSANVYLQASIAFGKTIESALEIASVLDLQTGDEFDIIDLPRTLWKPKRLEEAS